MLQKSATTGFEASVPRGFSCFYSLLDVVYHDRVCNRVIVQFLQEQRSLLVREHHMNFLAGFRRRFPEVKLQRSDFLVVFRSQPISDRLIPQFRFIFGNIIMCLCRFNDTIISDSDHEHVIFFLCLHFRKDPEQVGTITNRGRLYNNVTQKERRK